MKRDDAKRDETKPRDFIDLDTCPLRELIRICGPGLASNPAPDETCFQWNSPYKSGNHAYPHLPYLPDLVQTRLRINAIFGGMSWNE